MIARPSRRTLLQAGLVATAAPLLPLGLTRPVLGQDAGAPGHDHGQGYFQGVQRRRIGGATVHALFDGFLPLPAETFPGVTAEQYEQARLAAFRPDAPMRSPVNAFLVDVGGRRVLIDSGTSVAMGDTLGKLPQALAAAGVDPASVEIVALTHLHPDHVNGIVGPDGAAAFPNAELVMADSEAGFWLAPGPLEQAPEAMRGFIQMAQSAVAPYGERIRRIAAEGTTVVPGLTSVALPGHTPGHVGYLLEDGGQQLMIWGDIIHNGALQFPQPEITITFDADPDAARQTRMTTLDRAATDRLLVAGAHVDFPGFGYVERRGGGSGYHFVPATFPYGD